MADDISRKMVSGVSETFQIKSQKGFLLEPTKIFEGLNRLSIDESFILVLFGFDLDQYINHYKIPELTRDNYKGVPIASYNGNNIVRDSIFVLKKEDLPSISTKLLEAATIEKYKLNEPLSQSPYLYASVLDMNKAGEEIFLESRGDKTDDELKKHALVTLAMTLEITWKKDIRMIQIMEYSEYRQQGTPNDLKDVKWD
jgi:hypothetical protein